MNRKQLLQACGASVAATVLDALPSSGQAESDVAKLRRNFPTMRSRHEQYKLIAQAMHDYGLDIYFFDAATLTTNPWWGFGSADSSVKAHILRPETDAFLSGLNAQLFERRNALLSANLLAHRNLVIDGKKYATGQEADVAILLGEQVMAQKFLDTLSAKAEVVHDLNQKVNLFADDVQYGRPSHLAIALLPFVPKTIKLVGELTLEYITQQLMYMYQGRELLRKKEGDPTLLFDYGQIEHRMALGKACLAQVRAARAVCVKVVSQTPTRTSLRLSGKGVTLQSSGVFVERGDLVSVSASGKIVTHTIASGEVVSGPDGTRARLMLQPPRPAYPFQSLLTVVQHHEMTPEGMNSPEYAILGSGSFGTPRPAPISGAVCVFVNNGTARLNNGYYDVEITSQRIKV